MGFAVTLYAYGDVRDLPDDIKVRDAREIAPADFLERFRIGGRPNVAHFADYFRYRMFEVTDAVWIDTDMLCLRPFSIPVDRHFLTRETHRSLNNAIVRIVRGDGLLDRMIADTMALVDQPLAWGATGPLLMTKAIGQAAFDQAAAPSAFYPIHWRDWWKPFLPDYRAWCEAASQDSNAVHLWNNIVERSGYWKDLAPPRGSFLHERLGALGLLDLFKEVLPEAVMKAMVVNDTNLQTADHMPIPRLARVLASRARAKLRR